MWPVALTAIALAVAVPENDADAATVSVNVGNFWFCSPAFQNGVCDTNVNRGDTVLWNWVAGTHTVTECGTNWSKGNGCTGANWTSPLQSSGTFSHAFNTTGTEYYRCTMHPAAMRGRVIVADPDGDADGWSNYLEGIIGTDPAARCPASQQHNAWPADINNDGFSDISDITALAGSFGKAVPAQAPARHNIAPDPPDGFVDITDITRLAGLFGNSCSGP